MDPSSSSSLSPKQESTLREAAAAGAAYPSTAYPYGHAPPPTGFAGYSNSHHYPPHMMSHPHAPYSYPPPYAAAGATGPGPYYGSAPLNSASFPRGYAPDAAHAYDRQQQQYAQSSLPYKQHSSARGGGVVGSSPTAGFQREMEQDSNKPDDDERLPASTSAEETLSEVTPIQTDFHFFVMANKDRLLAQAQEEVGSNADNAYLLHTNLNSRLMKAWEDLSRAERDVYVKKEEADRRRFMEEDEVASRHCATLTARTKSPKSPTYAGKTNSQREASDQEDDEEDDEEEEEAEAASPVKKVKTDDRNDGGL
jgi:hypothetical protein